MARSMRESNKAVRFYFLPMLAFVSFSALAEEIQIDLSQVYQSSLRQGFLNGPNHYSTRTPTSDAANRLISAVKPTSWRFSGIRGYGYGGNIYGFVVEDYGYDSRFGTSTVLNLQDIFNARHGNPVTIKTLCPPRRGGCFASFDSLREAWNTTLSKFLNDTKGARISFFDLLAEPDATFKNVSSVQLYELAKDAYRLVKQIRPDAKIVGPSLISFKPRLLEQLIANMVKDGIRFDAVSWHELGNDPDVTGKHVETMRAIFTKYPEICRPSCPEIHINEYQGEETTFVPGHTVGWLGNLESARVDQANRACWGGDKGSPVQYESCWYGFSGLLMPDGVTPQPLYWIYKFYAELDTSRFSAKSTLPKITAISGPLSDGRIGVLVGNYGTNQTAAQLQLANFTKARAEVDVIRIGNTFNKVKSLQKPEKVKTFSAAARNSILSLPSAMFAAGDAYWIVITPAN